MFLSDNIVPLLISNYRTGYGQSPWNPMEPLLLKFTENHIRFLVYFFPFKHDIMNLL